MTIIAQKKQSCKKGKEFIMAVYFDEKQKTWYCKFRYTDWTGESKSTSKRGFKLKRDALQYEKEYKDKAKDRPKMTLRQLSDAFLEDYKANRKPTSYSLTERNLRNYILPVLGSTAIDDLTPIIIKKWQNHLLTLGKSESSIKAYNTTFNTLLNFGVKFYGLQSNPFRVTGTTGHIKKRLEFLEENEWKKLDNVISDIFDKALFNLLFFSGIRIGEARALTRDDIDFEKNTISISKTYNLVSGISKPKTKNSYRKIVIPEQACNHIKKLFESFYDLPEYPFQFRIPRTVAVHLKAYCMEAGVTVITPHGFRHSHASMLIKRQVPINAVASRLGDTVAEVMRTYSHCYKEQDSEIAALLETI